MTIEFYAFMYCNTVASIVSKWNNECMEAKSKRNSLQHKQNNEDRERIICNKKKHVNDIAYISVMLCKNVS